MFGKRKAQKAEWAAEAEARAAEWDDRAREAKGRAADLKRRRVPFGGDPAGDRYLTEEADADRRLAEAGARDARNTAKELRKWWT